MIIRKCWSDSKYYELDIDFPKGKVKSIKSVKNVFEKKLTKGVGCWVWHYPCVRRFWCVFVCEKKDIWVVIGTELFLLSSIRMSLHEGTLFDKICLNVGIAKKQIYLLPLWIQDPLSLIDYMSSDNLDHEMSSFPFYLISNMYSEEWLDGLRAM